MTSGGRPSPSYARAIPRTRAVLKPGLPITGAPGRCQDCKGEYVDVRLVDSAGASLIIYMWRYDGSKVNLACSDYRSRKDLKELNHSPWTQRRIHVHGSTTSWLRNCFERCSNASKCLQVRAAYKTPTYKTGSQANHPRRMFSISGRVAH